MKHPFLVGLAAYGWRAGLLFLAVLSAAVMVFGTPDTVKASLKDSGAYDKAASRLAIQASEAISSELGNDTDRQLIDTTAKQNIKPESLQTEVEQNVDATYLWLDGTSASPKLKIDLRPYVTGFTESLGDQALERAEVLPACTPDQLRQLNPSTVDVLNLPCRPPGINLAGAKDLAIAQATGSNEFLRNPVLTSDSLPKDEQGNTIIDRADNLPTVFQWAKRAPWIFGSLALLSAVLMYFLLRSDWRLATRKLARSLFGVGITLVILSLVARLGVWYISRPDNLTTKLTGGEYGDVILTFITSLLKSFGDNVLLFSIGYLAIAAAALLTLRFLKPSAPATKKARPGTAGRL